MATSPEVNRARFAQFISRVLADARDRGMTDTSIHKATGIPPSTFHRWQKAQFATAPDLDKIRQFCVGLGVDPTEAITALGMAAPGRRAPEHEPPMPPEIRLIMRRLADPNVPDAQKIVIREMLLMLAERAEQQARRQRGGGREAI